jgi:hypothetical protein
MKGARCLLLLSLLAIGLPTQLRAGVMDFYDRTHFSSTFDEWRHYRIILPDSRAGC